MPQSAIIKYADSPGAAIHWLRTPAFQNAGAVGFDLEWRATMKKNQPPGPVALLQLAVPDFVLLLHIFHFDKIPEELIELLASRSVFKLGVNVKNDARKLHKDYGLVVNGILDLATHARRLHDANAQPPATPLCGRTQAEALAAFRTLSARPSLATISETFLNRGMFKGPQTRRSDWEIRPLSKSQFFYAACDAYVALAAFDAMGTFSKPGEKVPGKSGVTQPTTPVKARPGPWDALLPTSPKPLVYSDSTKYVLTEYEPSGKPKHGGVTLDLLHFSEVLESERVIPRAPATTITPAPVHRPELFLEPIVGTSIGKENFAPASSSSVVPTADPPSDASSEYEDGIDCSKLTDADLDVSFAQEEDEFDDGGIDFDGLSAEELRRLDGPVFK
jgi:hypothetical protein